MIYPESAEYGSFYPVPWFAWRDGGEVLRVDDSILNSVVFIGRADRGPFVPYGTAFLVAQRVEEDLGFQTLVTARHVLEMIGDSPDVAVRVNTRSGEARVIKLRRDSWFMHPDPRIDVAVCPSILPRDEFNLMHYALGDLPETDNKGWSLTSEHINTHNIGVGDEVYVTGLFVPRVGEKANVPIVRLGSIAAMSGEPIETQYGYHEAFLVEMHSIDGLSGSPICVHLEPDRHTSRHPAVLGALIDPRTIPPPPPPFYVMGMVLGYNEVTNPFDGLTLSSATGSEGGTKMLAPMNTGIAVVLPIWKIMEAINQPAILEGRNVALERRKQGQRRFVPSGNKAAAPLISEGEVEVVLPSDNPSHKEDFTSLLRAAAKGNKSAS